MAVWNGRLRGTGRHGEEQGAIGQAWALKRGEHDWMRVLSRKPPGARRGVGGRGDGDGLRQALGEWRVVGRHPEVRLRRRRAYCTLTVDESQFNHPQAVGEGCRRRPLRNPQTVARKTLTSTLSHGEREKERPCIRGAGELRSEFHRGREQEPPRRQVRRALCKARRWDRVSRIAAAEGGRGGVLP